MTSTMIKLRCTIVLICLAKFLFAQYPADTFPIVSLCNMDLNRTATKLSASNLNTVSPAVTGYKWNSGDASTLKWRPQGITGMNAGCKEFSVVSWYGRNINNNFPCTAFNADYRNRGSRVSFVDITDMDSIRYRHVLLVDETYNTFYDMHAGGIVIINDTLYVPDSRSTTDAMYAFPLDGMKEVPSNQLSAFYDYRYILTQAASPVDSLPINPSFVSYDWDDQKLVTGSFQNCPSNNCNTPQNNRLMWFNPGTADRMTPFYDGLFGKMQGVGTATNLDNPNKKDVWVSTSYGYDNNSRLYAFTYDFGANTTQSQSINFDNDYAYFSLPPGLEDIHLTPNSDTIWTLTEFSPDHPACLGSSNQRYVFGLLRSDIRPASACDGDINISQFNTADTIICTPTTLTYEPVINYVAYANFDKLDNTWAELDDLSDTLASSNRSVFLWLKQVTPVSNESQVLFAINTATGGNISNLQVGTNEKVGIYDGSNSHYGTTTVTDGQWHHVGYTYNEVTNETKVYVDGVEEVAFNNAQTAVTTALISLGQEFDSGLSKGNYLEGKVTELTVWNEVLNSTDIALLMNTTVKANHPKRSNLMGYYPMNKVCGDNLTIMNDISGNDFHGKISGTILSNGVNVQSIETLEQITNFNSSDHFNLHWELNGALISSTNPLVLSANTYTSGNYSAVFTRNPFIVTEAWDITINYTTATDVQTACNTYTWIDGMTYTASNNVATQTLTNVLGCDSIVTLNLTINNSNTGVDVQTACNTYTWIDGMTYTASNNTATQTLTNTGGCDSVVILDLSLTNIDTSTTISGLSIMSNESGATYQWLDCNNGNAPIAGATNQSYTPTSNGVYAVEITKNGCTSLSSCLPFTVVGINVTSLNTLGVAVFPNPTKGMINLHFDQRLDAIETKIITMTGQVIDQQSHSNLKELKLEMPSVAGVYIVEIASGQNVYNIKVIKE
jgi:hypothetical protein